MSDKTFVDSFREIVQDLLVPELKAVKVSVEGLRNEMKLNTEALREEIRLNTEAVREEMKLNNESMREEMRIRFQASERHTETLIKSLVDKLEFNADIRERMAALEARLPRQ